MLGGGLFWLWRRARRGRAVLLELRGSGAEGDSRRAGRRRTGNGLLGRSLIADATPAAAETVTRRPADEAWSVEPTTVRGLVMRRTLPARQPLPPLADAASQEDLLAPVLSDEAVARPRERTGLAALLGARRGR